MRSVDSVCPQAAFSRSCYAWGQGGSLTKDQGQAEMGVDIPILTIPMALVDLCLCSQALSSRLSQLSILFPQPYHFPSPGQCLSLGL